MTGPFVDRVKATPAGEARILYLSHGGGPLPLLNDLGHRAMVEFMRVLPTSLARPESIIVISAHWEAETVCVTGGTRPTLIYDYSGFPPESYRIRYPALGSPELAQRVSGLMSEAGIPSRVDAERGFDHGLFVPLKLLYPEADIPVIQLSLHSGLDPSVHLSMGEALRCLLGENLLVIGSGFSFHNMWAFERDGVERADEENNRFQDWLIENCCQPSPQADRLRRLEQWVKAPGARHCHPREEHLLPLHVCVGMAGRAGRVVFDEAILGKRSLAILW